MLVSSNEFKMERINTIRDILAERHQIVVTHTAGLVKPQMPKTAWQEAALTFRAGEEHDLKALLNRLVEYGYKREYTVEKPGDFSLRGGIFTSFRQSAVADSTGISSVNLWIEQDLRHRIATIHRNRRHIHGDADV